MNAADALSAIAQLGLGLAGFTGIVVAFGRRPGRVRPVEGYRLAILLSLSLGAMSLALLPLGIANAGMGAPLLWQTCSALFAALTALFLLAFSLRTKRFLSENPEIFDPAILIALATVHAGNGLVQVANAFGLWGEAAPGVYVLGLVWLVLHGAYQFVRLLFIPLARP